MNKLGVIHPSAVLAILPHPTSPLLFYVIHQDGHIFTYSLERDDPVLAPGTTAPWTGLVAPTADWHSANPDQPGLAFWRNPPPARESEKEKDKTRIIGRNPVAVWRVDAGLTGRQTGGQRKKAEHSSGGAAGGGGDGLGGVPMASGAGSGSTTGVGGQASAPSTPVTTTGPSAAGGGGSGNTANPTYNFAPTTMDPRGLTAASLSPDGKLLALAGDDGLLRIVDIGLERYVGSVASLFLPSSQPFLIYHPYDLQSHRRLHLLLRRPYLPRLVPGLTLSSFWRSRRSRHHPRPSGPGSRRPLPRSYELSYGSRMGLGEV